MPATTLSTPAPWVMAVENVQKVAEMLGLTIPADTVSIGVKIEKTGFDEPLTREKMFPLFTVLECEDFKDGVVETVYLLVGAECGIPALLDMLAWFFWYWVSCVRLMKRLKRSTLYFLPAGLFGGLTAVYVQSCFEWVLRQQLNLLCLMFFFAIISYLNTDWMRIRNLELE